MGRYKKNTVAALALIMISVPFGVIPYFIISRLINSYLAGIVTVRLLLVCSAAVFLSFAVKYTLYGLGLGESHKGAYGTLLNLRNKLAEDLLHQPLGEIVDGGTGKYKKSFVEDIGRVELMLAHMLPEGIPNIILPVVVLVIIFCTDWRMGLLSLGSLPFGIIGMKAMMKSGVKKMPLYYEAGARLNSSIVEYVSGMEVIKIFGQTTSSYQKYRTTVHEYKTFTLDWYRESWKYMAMVYAGMPFTVILTLPVGAILYVNGFLNLPTWIFVMMLDLSISSPLTKVINFFPLFPHLQYTVNQLESLYAVPDVQSGTDRTPPDTYDISFTDVTFAYHDRNVLDHINFTAAQNKMTAIVGESGSGKSTIARLIVHYWDVRGGSIKIGGRDIREYTFDTLMNMTSYVAQDTFLFKGTIADNIRMGKQNALDEEMYAAAQAAACHDFIMALPDTYNTDAGSLGGKLSGGEKQRITIARAILKDAPIIILDEATAFTDAENEDLIQQAVENLTKNKTVLVIAHRLGTICNADSIIVMKAGQVCAEGSHEQLLASSEVYQKLWRMSQLAGDWNLAVKEEAAHV
jgi:ATP-binding cassette, subfamily B, bacterial IrtA/YbtP